MFWTSATRSAGPVCGPSGASTRRAAKNLRAFAEIIASLPPENTAETFVEHSMNGEMDFVLQLFSELEPRVAAKILAEIKDAGLRAEIATEFSELNVIR